MSWTASTRTGFEAALVRADTALRRAADHADSATDEGALEDLTQVRLELDRLLAASQAERRSVGLPRPIPGQTSIEVTGEAPRAPRAPRKARAPRQRAPRGVTSSGTAQDKRAQGETEQE